MQQHMVVAVMASVMWALVGGTALGQVAGSTTIGVTVDEQKVLAVGWSAKKQILGKAVYNSSGEKIGEVEDLIITPEKAVSYAIVGTGGFLGMAQHDVAIPVGQLKLEGDKLMLPGATKEGLKALPKFEYAKSKSEAVQGGDGCAAPDHTRDTFPANCPMLTWQQLRRFTQNAPIGVKTPSACVALVLLSFSPSGLSSL